MGFELAGRFSFHLSCSVPAPPVVLQNANNGGTSASSLWLLEGTSLVVQW